MNIVNLISAETAKKLSEKNREKIEPVLDKENLEKIMMYILDATDKGRSSIVIDKKKIRKNTIKTLESLGYRLKKESYTYGYTYSISW